MGVTHRNTFVGLSIAFLATAALAWAQVSGQESRESGGAVYELRTYTTHPGRLEALHARFRDHTMRLFEKHEIQNVTYWTPLREDGSAGEETLVYVLKHKSLEAARRSWQGFRNDPEWQTAKAASEADGPIVKKVESVYLKPTDYSPHR